MRAACSLASRGDFAKRLGLTRRWGGMVRNLIGDPGELLILRRDRRFESAFL
jgi:hypothetical protein